MTKPLDIVIFGLSITSSWGNGHATTYRALVRALSARGHNVCFLERDMPWYAEHRDLPNPPYGLTQLYKSPGELKQRFARKVANADVCIVGSYVPDGIAIGEWVVRTCRGVKAFYDIDTPITLGRLAAGDAEYVSARLVRRYDLYLSFTGGPVLRQIERELGSPMARALYCSVDPKVYFPEEIKPKWDVGYMGTYSVDRQPSLDELLIEPARRSPELKTVVAGPMYPAEISWPANVERIEHLPPASHRKFYNSQRFTLNLTRADMRAAGYSPSVRIFEAAACGTPIISDYWPGLESLFNLDEEILTASSADEALFYLKQISEKDRRAIWRACTFASARRTYVRTTRDRTRKLRCRSNADRRDNDGQRSTRGSNGMTTFFLIRHGSCAGLGHTLWGRTPGVCLNERGKFQAQRLAERFSGMTFQAVYSSPLERAVETAEVIARNMNLEVQQNPAFHEVNFGDWTGKSFDMLSSDEQWRRFNTHRSATKIPGGESFLDVQNRVVAALDELSIEHGKAQVAIVSHADVIKAAVGYFAGTPIDLLQRIEISPCSVSVIALDKESAGLLTINNRSELDQLWSD